MNHCIALEKAISTKNQKKSLLILLHYANEEIDVGEINLDSIIQNIKSSYKSFNEPDVKVIYDKVIKKWNTKRSVL